MAIYMWKQDMCTILSESSHTASSSSSPSQDGQRWSIETASFFCSAPLYIGTVADISVTEHGKKQTQKLGAHDRLTERLVWKSCLAIILSVA
jgi:hypothetical protein